MARNLSSVMTFTLIQQTPILHFQYNEKGACLRASELKPKLDKFIIKKLNNDEKKINKWLIKRKTDDSENKNKSNKGHKPKKKSNDIQALNYKVKIVSLQEPDTQEPYPLYYGNMGNNKIKMIYTPKLELTIVCFIEDLRKTIKANIEEFFVIHNFGRMQNKGFGSFLIEGQDKRKIGEALSKNYKAKKCYQIVYTDEIMNKEPYSDSEENLTLEKCVFEEIKRVYSIMKSGINQDEYIRGYIYKYFHEQGINNEKREMKEEGVSPNIKKSTTHIMDKGAKPNETRYVRAMLGIGSNIYYIKKLDENDNPITKNNKSDKNKEKSKILKEKIIINNTNKIIKRYASPILFKVVKDTDKYIVHIVARRPNKYIFDKEFIFENGNTKKHTKISTPSEDEFNIDKFMEGFVDYYNRKNKGKPQITEVE